MKRGSHLASSFFCKNKNKKKAPSFLGAFFEFNFKSYSL
ncbi:hypothetical protein BDW_03385 [Bdellovibrio bacteriovorus W]|nr:hypothetical protein BDW_03385 [Bdellovibrio bacteriovorus W]